MEGGSIWERGKKDDRRKGERQGLGLEPKIEPFVPRKGHDPTELRSWAKRTGFVSTFSGESDSGLGDRREFGIGRNVAQNGNIDGLDLEKGGNGKIESVSPKIEIDPVLGRTRNRKPEIEPFRANGRTENGGSGYRDGNLGDEREARIRVAPQPAAGATNVAAKDGPDGKENGIAPEVGANSNSPVLEQKKVDGDSGNEATVDRYADEEEAGGNGGWYPSPRMVIGLKDNPGYVSLVFHGFQHYLSLAGSLIFIPLIIVPAMGGTDKDTSSVISTMLLLSGITTILHSYFGTRLPLVQGSSFVYLAPALVIINSREFRDLSENQFRLTMRELQGAIIISSLIQCILGFSGLMSLLLRLINPVVIAPTVAAVGLAFFSYGFPQAGACVEISLPEILLILLFTLYLRGVSIFGNRIFRIYAVPLSVMIIWAYAFFLTAGGAYNFKGCSPDIPSSNALNDSCRRHAYTMKHCRTDVSDAMRTAEWIRIPYPLQWGIPIFRLRTSLIMIFVSLVASVESVGTYHTASIRINAKTPTPGTVSRGIGTEGFCSLLAGLWGSGTGSSTLIENVHTISTTKVASRKVIVAGAVFMIIFSLIGKIGAILASIPQALAAAVLCFIWALVVALGLSTLQYTQTSSFRNITIVGVALFLGLSIPAFIQQYPPVSTLILPSYLIPYSAASDGPVRIGNKELDFVVNGVLSLSMVVTMVIAFVLDNTVPGSKEERGVYAWSSGEDEDDDPSSLSDYRLPRRIASCFRWAKCLDIR